MKTVSEKREALFHHRNKVYALKLELVKIYKGYGWSNQAIAENLGLKESSVRKLLKK